ncbi:MAG: SDR family oxidoreductase [Granulosicoccaceae bacterium]
MSKVALVTGGGSGIGRETAHALVAAGWHVIVCGRTADSLDETIQSSSKPASMASIPTDVSDSGSVDALFAAIKDQHGHLDLIFNNAGTSVPPMTIDELTVDQWKSVIDVNLHGAFLIARGAFSMMRNQDPQGGRIINNGSISAHVPRPGTVPYAVSKHAITGLTRCLSLDGRPFNIACGQIDIGNASSAMTEAMSAGIVQADGSTKSEAIMDVKHVGEAVVNMGALPLSANVQFMTIMSSSMPFIGRG